MSDYLTVTEQDLQALARERVRALELDHARQCLVLAEVADTPAAEAVIADLRELERRIGVHTGPRSTGPRSTEPDPAYLSNPADDQASNEPITATTASDQ